MRQVKGKSLYNKSKIILLSIKLVRIKKMFKNLLTRFFGYRLGQVVRLVDFDKLETACENSTFKAFDAVKGRFGYWVVLNSDLNRYVVARKYKL